jgi:hypothetical protein
MISGATPKKKTPSRQRAIISKNEMICFSNFRCIKLAATRNALTTAIPKAVIIVTAGISSIGPATLIANRTRSQYQIFT